MESALNNSLMEIFMRQMVEPVTNALQQTNTELTEEASKALQSKIKNFRENLIQEINSIHNGTCSNDDDVNETIKYLIEKVEEMEESQLNEAPTSPPHSMPEILFEHMKKQSTNLTFEQTSEKSSKLGMLGMRNTLIWDAKLQTLANDLEPVEVEASQTDMKNTTALVSPLTVLTDLANFSSASKTEFVSPIPSSPENSMKRMSLRKRAKRSLADTVEMLSTDVKKTPKDSSVSPPPSQAPQFTFPQVPLSFTNSIMQRWLGAPFSSPVYLNALNIFQRPTSSEEQLTNLMRMSMTAATASYLKSVKSHQVKPPVDPMSVDSDSDDIKIDVESDEGEVGISPSPSNGDATETESSSSSSLTTASPSSGDGESSTDKPFICIHNNCGKRFANKFLLKKHMFIHTGLRPHTCPHCHKKFNRKDNLLRHKKTHLPTGTQLGQILPKVNFPGVPQLPTLHNLALPPSFNHFHHSLKFTLDNGVSAVRSLS